MCALFVWNYLTDHLSNYLSTYLSIYLPVYVEREVQGQVDALNTAEELRHEYEEALQMLLPLYKLKVGVSKSSEGIPCAASAGE